MSLEEKNTTLGNSASASASASDAQDKIDKEALLRKIREEAAKIKVHQTEGPYTFDNPHLEHKTKRQKKLEELESKYRDKPKIAFHTLTDEGNMKFMQIKRDMIWTTLGWSFIGNIAGILMTQYLENNSNRWRTLKHFRKRETMKVAAFLGTLTVFTIYGYGRARQEFVREKLRIVENYSVKASEK